MSENGKYKLKCISCAEEIEDFSIWFDSKQRCPKCGSNQADVIYNTHRSDFMKLISPKNGNPESLWHYFPVLPLIHKENIISFGEGVVPIQRWRFLEEYIKQQFAVHCIVYAQRNDMNFPTGTFKDMAGTVVASVLKENGQKNYVAASTGNTAVTFSKYLASADIQLYGFIPNISSKMQEAEICCFGQKAFRVDGDYARAKETAGKFSEQNDFLLAAGNFDPMRIEAKKTMVYEWLRILEGFPTAYVQALSGGTGPLAIAKAFRELEPLNILNTLPRQIMVQPNKCAPMAHAWQKAKDQGYPDGWENDYPIYENPETAIPTLSTGNPKTYPVVAKFVRETDGEIIEYDEERILNIARLVAFETSVLMGPAAALPVGGFLKSAAEGFIKEGDIVLINIGEGVRRSPDFLEKFMDDSEIVKDSGDCSLHDRNALRKKLWEKVTEEFI